MKKSVEILGLPVISITEGRELGLSKSLLIDAKNGLVAAITIEDDDWYRGVKLIPYESVIAIGADAVTITHSENILKLEDAGDYEALLDENIRVIGTKAITKNGMIQGTVTEIYVGDDGRIEKCEITAPDGTASDVTAEQISIFGKQVTVIEAELEKKTELITDIGYEPEHEVYVPTDEPIVDSFYDNENEPAVEPAVEESYAPEPEPAADSFSQPEHLTHELSDEPEPEPAVLESMMTPEPTVELPTVEEPIPEPVVEEPIVEEPIPEPIVEEQPTVELPTIEEPIPEPIVEEQPTAELPTLEEPIIEEQPTAELPTVEEPIPEPVVEEQIVEEQPTVEEPIPEPVVEEPIVEEQPTAELPTVEEPIPEPVVEESIVEEVPAVEENISTPVEISPIEQPVEPIPEPKPVESIATAPVEEPIPEPIPEPIAEEPIAEEPIVEQPIVEQKPASESIANAPTVNIPAETIAALAKEPPKEESFEQRTRHKTQQAEILKEALRRAMAKQAKIKSDNESRRTMFIGKHATKTIKTDSGVSIVEEGAEVTEAVFQKARLANKLAELSKNIQ